ncbi:uncharacterized protein [Henckelia pumila]|uniref:uncharacterized protein n=1 Tax=Henckelia pumila TaxID=405737 RepID=UPI003C6DCDF2
MKYLEVLEELGADFITWSIEQIPRKENIEADALAKRAVIPRNDDDKDILKQMELVAAIETLDHVSREDTWIAPMVKYLTTGDIHTDEGRAWVIWTHAPQFSLLSGMLYRRSYQGPLLRCLTEEETEYVLRKVHEGCCGNHGGSMSLAQRVLLSGPANNFKPVWASFPFDQWGLDIVGPFPQARAQKIFLFVAVDYFYKWVEAKPLAKITEGEVMKFLWKNIVCRFGLPRKLVSDNGRQFQGQKLADCCAEMVDIGQPSARIRAYEETEEGAWSQELDLIEERREKEAQRMEVYRARVMRAYNQKVKHREFQEGEFVLKKVNPAGEVEKLDARWEGPYKLIRRVGMNTWYL